MTVIVLEVENLLIPEDQKMKQIDIIDLGATAFVLTIYGWGRLLLRVVRIWLLFGFLVMMALCIYHLVDIYRMRRRSRLLRSPIGNVA